MPIGTGGYLADTIILASGSVGSGDIQTGSVLSGNIASGQVGRFHHASGESPVQVDAANIYALVNAATAQELRVYETFTDISNYGRVSLNFLGGNFRLMSQAAGTGTAKSLQINFDSYSIQSTGGTRFLDIDTVGVMTVATLGSGIAARQGLQAGGNPIVSGTTTILPVITQITAEVVSGNVAVYVNQSGQIGVAMAAVSGRDPAVGVALGNALSGTTVVWAQVGALQFLSGMADFSGYVGKRAWLGRSGQITTISGSWSSGGFASGDIGQPIGVIANSGGIHFNVSPVVWSGGPLGVAMGGVL